VPTSRAGEEVDQKHAQLKLKNIVKDVRSTLEESGKVEEEVHANLQRLEELQNDDHFFRHQSDGLAIYLQGSEMSYFTLPVHFEPAYYVADHFYLIPVLPFFNDDGTFYLLALSQQKATLYEGSRHFMAELILDQGALEPPEEEAGTKEKSLQFRSAGGAQKGVLYHGQGSGKDDRHKDLEKYFHSVDQAVNALLRNDKAPLVLACVDAHFAVYRDLTAYNFLFPDYIPGNPDETDAQMLHEKGWDLVEEYFLNERKAQREQMRNLSAGGRTSYLLEEILQASLDGRIETLFLQKGIDKYGLYDQQQRAVIRVRPAKEKNSVSLFNLAASHALVKGARVFLENKENMPFQETEINALFRY
jgi:hypothetical protein